MEAFASVAAVLGACAIAGVLPPSHTALRSVSAAEVKVASMTIAIPRSVQIEHAAIHSALEDATKAPDPVGKAARALAEVLHPHFVREEQIALPPLGLLARLAGGTRLTDAEVAEALDMTDSLRRELPRMLDEHKRIRKAVESLLAVAQAEHAVRYVQLAEQLALHAQSEEEVLYPAAVLVGDVIRAQIKRD